MVDVSSREPNDDRGTREAFAETHDRGVALAGVERNQKVGRLAAPRGDDGYVVAELR